MLTNTISQEVLAIGAKTTLVDIIKTYVKGMREIWPDYPNNDNRFSYNAKPWRKLTTEFVESIYRKVGPKVNVDVYSGHDNFNMGVTSQVKFYGHSGSRWYDNAAMKLVVVDEPRIDETLEIDLKNVTVRGNLVEALQFRLFYPESVMFNKAMFTDEEVIAVILHEFGHIFDTFMTLGDYVWLNYYLTDGIEILLGKKPNKLKLELLSENVIRDKVPAEDFDAFVNDRNEDSAKRVILSMVKLAPRHHLTQNDLISIKREEQLADLFTSRLGYARAMAQFNYKCDKYFGDPDLLGVNWYAETAKALTALVMLPLTVLWVMGHNPTSMMATRYDDPITRIMRTRRDLIAQLKNPGPMNKDEIAADIEVMDALMKEYAGNKSFYNGLLEFFRPSIRKQNQNTRVENDLESLFHNDLFVQAFKLSKL